MHHQCHYLADSAFSAVTLLVNCVGWLGGRKSIRRVKNWAIGCWCGYLSGARCSWFACGPADTTDAPSSPASLKSRIVLLMCICVCCVSALTTTQDIIQNKLSWSALFKPSDFFHKYRQEIMSSYWHFSLHACGFWYITPFSDLSLRLASGL